MIGQSNYQNLDQLIWSRRRPVTTAKCLVRADQCLGLGSVSPSCRPQWSEAPCHLRPYLDPKFKLIQRYCKHYAPWRYCSMISLSNNANLEAHYVSSIYKKATANMDDWRGYTDLNGAPTLAFRSFGRRTCKKFQCEISMPHYFLSFFLSIESRITFLLLAKNNLPYITSS